ncbi:MAG: hypothetical protein AAGA20_01485 [Planctomycetota bacterium]
MRGSRDEAPALSTMRSVHRTCFGALLLALTPMAAGQDEEPDDSAWLEASVDELPQFALIPETPYFSGGRVVGVPGDIELDLDTSFPKSDSVFGSLIPSGYFGWKEQVYEDHGIKLAFGYQTLVQRASRSPGERTGWGGWAQIEGKWEIFNRGDDYEGGLVFDLDWRHDVGGRPTPVEFGFAELGSAQGTDVAFFEWDPNLVAFYWDQWLEKDSFNFRVGKQLAANIFDFFRFKDPRTSFSAPAFTVAPASIPAPAFGYGASFKWWPKKGGSTYVVGTINDMNGSPTEYDPSTLFDESEFFYGLEIGTFWKRGVGDFDHLHLNLFYADETSSLPQGQPNEAGGGFKLAGSKQWDEFVSFGSYTYNRAEGGGLGLTLAEHTVNAGVAFLRPFGYRGELGLGLSWLDPINDSLDDEFAAEAYWKLLLTSDLWITPGIRFIDDPALSPSSDSIVIGQLKLRLFL